MNPREFVESLLQEDRVSDAKARYPGIPEHYFQALVDEQPLGSNNKYLDWCCKNYQGWNSVVEILAMIDDFYKSKSGKDINSFKSADDLRNFLMSVVNDKSKSSKQWYDKKASLPPIYQDEVSTVWYPKTWEEMRACGCSAWCVYRSSSEWDMYTKGGNNFSVINLNGNMWCGQFHGFKEGQRVRWAIQFWNDEDNNYQENEWCGIADGVYFASGGGSDDIVSDHAPKAFWNAVYAPKK